MNWQYEIDWFPTRSVTRKSIVTITSRPRSRDEIDLVSVKVWTDRDGVGDGQIRGVKPLAIFTSVTIGRRPVIGARVACDVQVENENGTIYALLPFQLLDNGLGGENATKFNILLSVE